MGPERQVGERSRGLPSLPACLEEVVLFFYIDLRDFKRKIHPSILALLMFDFLSVPMGAVVRRCAPVCWTLALDAQLESWGVSWPVPVRPEGCSVCCCPRSKSRLAEQVTELHPLVLRVLAKTS